MHLFYTTALEDSIVELPEAEAHHAIHVLRVKLGDAVVLTDGNGKLAHATVAEMTKKSVSLAMTELREISPERSAPIHIAIAPTKNIDRYEWFLEKATEIGIDRITPIITQRSERKKLRHDRSIKVLVAAMKQSQRSWLPQLDELILLKDFLQQELPAQKAFGWCEGEHASLMKWYSSTPSVVMIGPEGDFTEEEAMLFRSEGFAPISIGSTRLRTETAAIAAVTWMGLAQQ